MYQELKDFQEVHDQKVVGELLQSNSHQCNSSDLWALANVSTTSL